MNGHEELIKAGETREDHRAARLVTLSVGVRLDGAENLVLAGVTTGINEHGLGARVNLSSGILPPDPTGLPFRVSLNLPGGHSFRPIESQVLHISPCWIPGFRFFTALRFLQVDETDIRFLRDFIRWREENHFTPERPIRKWYLFAQDENRVFGPLTRAEVLDAAARKAIRSCDLIWSPMRGEWVSCIENRMEERLRSIEEEEFLTGSASEEDLEALERERKRSAMTPSTETPPIAAASPKRITPAEKLAGLTATPQRPPETVNETSLFAPLPKTTLLPVRWIVAAGIILCIAALLAAFIEGTLDRTEPGLILNSAREAMKVGDRSLAIRRFAELNNQFPGHRLAFRAQEHLVSLLRLDRRDREREIGLARLELLNSLPPELRGEPAFLNAIGDCLFRSGELAGAIERFESAHRMMPHNGVYQFNLGTALLMRREYQKAAIHFEEPGLMIGSDPRYHFNAALVFMGLKEKGRQRSSFDQAERLAANPAWLKMLSEAAEDPADAFVTIAEKLPTPPVGGGNEALRRLQADQPNVASVPNEAIPAETFAKPAPHARHLLIADFDLDGATEREIVSPAGAWTSRPGSLNIRAGVTHDPGTRVGAFGSSLRIDYSFFSDEPGEAGAWLLLEERHEPIDMTTARFLVLHLRGGQTGKPFPGAILIELRNRSQVSRVQLAGVTGDWREFRIPLVHFTGIADWRAMTELLVIVDPSGTESRSGVIHLDSIRLEG